MRIGLKACLGRCTPQASLASSWWATISPLACRRVGAPGLPPPAPSCCSHQVAGARKQFVRRVLVLARVLQRLLDAVHALAPAEMMYADRAQYQSAQLQASAVEWLMDAAGENGSRLWRTSL